MANKEIIHQISKDVFTYLFIASIILNLIIIIGDLRLFISKSILFITIAIGLFGLMKVLTE
ncbi:hypothetical protein K9L67_00890 [Candidatus Woesearchaeota archaeon]|nr:hypothetical protein [Candidatus Woesearchaeota archaeon]MCF7900759.1 hypothetical protein [Candidatus Woesearchaeota archaeon]MCF8012924.1 hypothetical protein [Candidatus Woesearchaeota archaeon]